MRHFCCSSPAFVNSVFVRVLFCHLVSCHSNRIGYLVDRVMPKTVLVSEKFDVQYTFQHCFSKKKCLYLSAREILLKTLIIE